MNAWSMLYDELNQDYLSSMYPDIPDDLKEPIVMTDEKWVKENGGYEYTPNPIYESPDGGKTVYKRAFRSLERELVKSPTNEKVAGKYKYDEETILKELKDYISSTYKQHYSAGDDQIQTLDLIEACGDGEAFCRSNILKYASRYDKKGTARRDIIKILHYAVLLLHFNDKNAKQNDERGYETF